jgi:hypothetical protein
VTVRRTTRFAGRTTRRVTVRFATVRFATTRCAWTWLATSTAPPPMIAPPHAQAQSFAKAIRTDMVSHSLVAGGPHCTVSSLSAAHGREVQNKGLSAIALTTVAALI